VVWRLNLAILGNHSRVSSTGRLSCRLKADSSVRIRPNFRVRTIQNDQCGGENLIRAFQKGANIGKGGSKMTRVLNKDRLPRMLRVLDADGLDKELSRTVASQEAAHTLLVEVIRSDSLIQRRPDPEVSRKKGRILRTVESYIRTGMIASC
jgi:hypothetical protein